MKGDGKERYLIPWIRQVYGEKETFAEFKGEALMQFCRGWGQELEKKTRFEFEFSPIMDQSGDIGFNQVFHSAIVTPEEWLGYFFR